LVLSYSEYQKNTLTKSKSTKGLFNKTTSDLTRNVCSTMNKLSKPKVSETLGKGILKNKLQEAKEKYSVSRSKSRRKRHVKKCSISKR